MLARLHILPAGLALLVSAFQFSRRIRTTYPALHRYSGRIYIVAGAVGAFIIAFKAHGTPVTRFGFGTLAVIWAWSVWQTHRHGPRAILPLTRWDDPKLFVDVRCRDVATRACYPGAWRRPPFDQAHAIVAGLSWIVNLVVAEWLFVERLRQFNAMG